MNENIKKEQENKQKTLNLSMNLIIICCEAIRNNLRKNGNKDLIEDIDVFLEILETEAESWTLKKKKIKIID